MKTENKFTAIYVDSWMSGSHRVSSTEMKRIQQNDGETIEEMLEREGIDNNIAFLFNGHPSMEGE